MLSISFSAPKLKSQRLLGIYILMLELVMLPASLILMANHLSWRWDFCNVVPGLNLILCPVLLPGAFWLTLKPSIGRTIAKFLTIAAVVLYLFLSILLIPFVCLFPQVPDKEYHLKNGDVISVSYNDQGAMGGSVFVFRERPFGPLFMRYESRSLRWSDPQIITLPSGKQMLSIYNKAPMDIDQFFLAGED